MKHLKYINETSKHNYMDIMNNIPKYVAVFQIIKNSSYCKNKIGEKVYFEHISYKLDTIMNNVRNGTTFNDDDVQVVISQLKFIEYLSIEELENQMKMEQETKKYNL